MVKLHIFIFHNLHQILAHIVGLPPSPVIDLDVLKKKSIINCWTVAIAISKRREDKIHLEEAEEKSVDGNGVDGEAGGGHDVGADHDQQDRDEAGDDDDKDGATIMVVMAMMVPTHGRSVEKPEM